jgi:hypothetical protein
VLGYVLGDFLKNSSGHTAPVQVRNRLLPDPGLPDGLFSNQKSKFGGILAGLAMEDVGIFYGHLVHFMDFCFILWSYVILLWTFDIVRGNLVYFFPLLYFVPRKIWQPWPDRSTQNRELNCARRPVFFGGEFRDNFFRNN